MSRLQPICGCLRAGRWMRFAGSWRQLVAALIARAEELGSTAMPSYTHLQKAEPVLSAHWLLAYAEMFFRDADRLADCRKRVNVLPLGSGAVAGSGLKLDRAGMAKELGFAGVTANSMDATSDRDFEIELLSVLSMIAVHMSRLAEEITIFSTREFGFITLPDSLSTGSSAMPQKKNPDATELFRAKAGRVAGDLLQATMTVKGLPLAYNKDMQELQLPLFDAVDAITGTSGSGSEVDCETRIQYGCDEPGGNDRLHECDGSRELPGAQRRAVPARA